MPYRKMLPLVAVLGVPFAAGAQPVQGLYVGGGIGANLAQDPRVSAGTVFGGMSHIQESPGAVGEASIGYGLGWGPRIELEGDFARNSIQKLSGTTFPTKADGSVRTWGVMLNALYDFDLGALGFPWVYPYVGAGAGYQWTNLHNASFTGTGFRFGTDWTSGAFAMQGIIGAAMPIQSVPGLSATLDYRFMDILGGAQFHGVKNVVGGGTFDEIQLHNQFNHSIILGVRYAFNTPAPAPAVQQASPAPAPAPSRSYLVFFDWDKATLTDRARQIIKEAADNSTRVQYTRLEVNGYADTSGTHRYNEGLSVRRAQAVAGELVRDGVPRESISIQGFGDTHLLVPTGPGVREPQNRRVEIIIR
jgi:OmpA-OmpF porin, OOP family